MGLTALIWALTLGSAGAHAVPRRGRRLIVSPRPGRSFATDKVPIVVRAGTAMGDLHARLNGVAIGGQFGLGRHRERVLQASVSEGLRRGTNVLTVKVWKGGGWRRSRIRFSVTGDEPLTGAGENLRVPVGTEVQLSGEVGLAAGDPGLLGEDWAITSEPGQGEGGPPAPVELEGATTMHPEFDPTAVGRYTVQLTTESGDGTSSDTTVIDVVPRNWLVPVDTQVAPTAEAPQPGIDVGGTAYRAPYLIPTATGGTYSEVDPATKTDDEAQWQVLALERETLRPVWNRTYGLCGPTEGDRAYCRDVEGKLQKVDFAAELRDLGPRDLVIVSSHPSGTATGDRWAAPIAGSALTGPLKEIGFPSEDEAAFRFEIERGPAAGSMSGVGAPGTGPGEAQWIVSGPGEGGGGRMVGYLTPRPSPPNYFEFTPSNRPAFDTRESSGCDAKGECWVVQTLGTEKQETVIPPREAGFLVTVLDRHDLKKLAAETFVTASEETAPSYTYERTLAMSAFIEKWAGQGDIVMISSQHGRQEAPVLYDRSIKQPAWAKLEAAIASIGGTRNALNQATRAEGGTYSMVGWGSLAEGEAAETWGSGEKGGRLRGSFVQDRRSKFGTTNVSSDGPASEALTKLALAPPTGVKWKFEGDRAGERAIAYIGDQVSELGPNPRDSYLTQKIDEASDSGLLRELERVTYPAGASFTEAEFTEARSALTEEVAAVARVRTYLGELASPAETAGQSSWEEADSLQNELKNSLEVLKKEGKVSLNFFSFIQAFAQIVGAGDWTKSIKAFAAISAAANGLAGQLYSHDWAGSPNGQNEILAINLAKELKRQSGLAAESVEGIGDMIVSDPGKLFELAKHAKCAPAECGEQYADFAYTRDMADLAKASVLRARDRVIYETLVPASYPIWDTGLARNPDVATEAEWFWCQTGDAGQPIPLYSPFNGAPELSHAKVLDQFDPQGYLDPAGDQTRWRTYISVAHDTSYGWAPKGILERMFDPIPENTEASQGGLGIDAGAFMAKAHRSHEYVPGAYCYWAPQR